MVVTNASKTKGNMKANSDKFIAISQQVQQSEHTIDQTLDANGKSLADLTSEMCNTLARRLDKMAATADEASTV